ncbi:MAG TPA: M24 family metallopeptidase [Acidimicrobiia bacterium]
MSRAFTLLEPGTMALEDGARVDFARMRRERLERCLAEMERHDVDALVLHREGNARYVSGARRLWRAVVTAFTPSCVVVRATGQVHLMSTWDDGIPAEIPNQNLYGLSWNPRNYVAALQAVDGLADARRLGVDGMSALFSGMLPAVAPNATLVDGERVMRAARMVKTPDELGCIRTAVAIAEGAMSDTLDAIEPGVPERDLVAAFQQRMTDFGVTTPATEGTFCATPREQPAGANPAIAPLRQIVFDRPVRAGELIACSAGVLYAGYEGAVGRTWPCLGPGATVTDGQRALHDRAHTVLDALAAQCHAGRTTADLRQAARATGEPLPPVPLAHGVGLGVEAPLVGGALGPELPAEEPLVPGMVLALTAYAWEPGVGGYLGREMVAITDAEPERLTRLWHGPLARD